MNAGGDGARKISGELDRDVADLYWADDASGVYFSASDHGTSNVMFAPLAGDVRPVTKGDHMLTGLTMIKGGRAAGVRSDARSPYDVVRIDIPRGARPPGAGTLVQLTHVNDDLLARIRLGEVKRIRYASTGGTQIDGWIVKPPGFDRTKIYPLIMEIHGGPHAMYDAGWAWVPELGPGRAVSFSA